MEEDAATAQAVLQARSPSDMKIMQAHMWDSHGLWFPR